MLSDAKSEQTEPLAAGAVVASSFEPDENNEEVENDIMLPVTIIAETDTTMLVQAVLPGAGEVGDVIKVWLPLGAVSGGTCSLSQLLAGLPYGDNLELLLTPSEVAWIGNVLAAELRRRDLWFFGDLQDGAKLGAVEQAIRVTLTLTAAALRRRARQLGG